MKLLTEHMLEKLSRISESLSTKDMAPAVAVMRKYCANKGIFLFHVDAFTIDNEIYNTILLYDMKTTRCACLMWNQMNSNSLYLNAVCFIDNFNKNIKKIIYNQPINAKSDLTIKLNNASLAKTLPMVVDVLKDKLKYRDFDSEIDKYKMFESLDDEEMEELNEKRIDIQELTRIRRRAYREWRRLRDSKASQKEIDQAKSVYDKARMDENAALREISSGETVSISNEESEADLVKMEQEYEMRATPTERFDDMEKYLKMVVAGLHPGLIICGAPGIGKTYRIMKYIKTTHEYGDTLEIIKGRSTTAALYTSLYNYSRPGDIIVIDDADEVFEDTNSINILKAALDSGEERLISYGTTRPPEISEEEAMYKHPELTPDNKGRYFCPKSFVFEGNIIFITNLRAGQLDTALRSRCYICELDFTVEESLSLIKDIMLAGGNPKISKESKERAYKYLKDLVDKGTNMEISMRTFDAVSKIYEAGGGDDERQFNRMVHDFVTLQFARGGKRF